MFVFEDAYLTATAVIRIEIIKMTGHYKRKKSAENGNDF